MAGNSISTFLRTYSQRNLSVPNSNISGGGGDADSLAVPVTLSAQNSLSKSIKLPALEVVSATSPLQVAQKAKEKEKETQRKSYTSHTHSSQPSTSKASELSVGGASHSQTSATHSTKPSASMDSRGEGGGALPLENFSLSSGDAQTKDKIHGNAKEVISKGVTFADELELPGNLTHMTIVKSTSPGDTTGFLKPPSPFCVLLLSKER